MSKEIYCDSCSKQIKVRDDLITATILLEVVPFHEGCYGSNIKGAKTLFVSNEPVNGFAGTFFAVISLILALLWGIFAEGTMKMIALIAIVPVLYRIYSFLKYERHLER